MKNQKSKSLPRKRKASLGIATNSQAAAARIGQKIEAVKGARDAGCDAFKSNGRVDCDALVAWLADHPKVMEQFGDVPSKAIETALWIRAKRMKSELELEILQNSYLPVDAMKRTFIRLASILKSRLLAIPSSVAPFVVGKPVHEIDSMIRERIIDSLREISTNDWNTENEK